MSGGISCAHWPSLCDLFRGWTDPRQGPGKRPRLATLDAMIACAKLSGRPGGYRAISLDAKSLTKPQRRAWPGWLNPRPGEDEVPSETSFFRAWRIVTAEPVHALIHSELLCRPRPASHGLPRTEPELDQGVPPALVRGFNKLAQGPGVYDPVRFPEQVLSAQTKEFREQNPRPKGGKLARCNRWLWRDAYPKEIDTAPQPEIDWLATSRELGKMGPAAFLGNNRPYWGIENGTHQRLDGSAWEDRWRIHDHNAVEIWG